MGAFDALERRIRELTLMGAIDRAQPRSVISLHTSAPAEDWDGTPGAFGEPPLGATAYTRAECRFGPAVDGASKNLDAVSFTGLPPGTYTHFAVLGRELPYSVIGVSEDDTAVFPGSTINGVTVPSQTLPPKTVLDSQGVAQTVKATVILADPTGFFHAGSTLIPTGAAAVEEYAIKTHARHMSTVSLNAFTYAQQYTHTAGDIDDWGDDSRFPVPFRKYDPRNARYMDGHGTHIVLKDNQNAWIESILNPTDVDVSSLGPRAAEDVTEEPHPRERKSGSSADLDPSTWQLWIHEFRDLENYQLYLPVNMRGRVATRFAPLPALEDLSRLLSVNFMVDFSISTFGGANTVDTTKPSTMGFGGRHHTASFQAYQDSLARYTAPGVDANGTNSNFDGGGGQPLPDNTYATHLSFHGPAFSNLLPGKAIEAEAIWTQETSVTAMDNVKNASYHRYLDVYHARCDYVVLGTTVFTPAIVAPGTTVPGASTPDIIVPPIYVPTKGLLPVQDFPLVYAALDAPLIVGALTDTVVVPIGGMTVRAD